MSQTEGSTIDVTQAIKIAKAHVTSTFADDDIENVGLEEVAFDEEHDEWRITIGFSRPWDRETGNSGEFAASGWSIRYQELLNRTKRTYKVVSISAVDGKVRKIENRPI